MENKKKVVLFSSNDHDKNVKHTQIFMWLSIAVCGLLVLGFMI